MISSSSDGRIRGAIASEAVDLGIIPSPESKVLKISIHSFSISRSALNSTGGNVSDDNF